MRRKLGYYAKNLRRSKEKGTDDISPCKFPGRKVVCPLFYPFWLPSSFCPLTSELTCPRSNRKSARKIAANGPLAVAVSKQVLSESQDWLSTEMFERQYQLTAPVFKSADAREGASPFAEKRTPVWRGE